MGKRCSSRIELTSVSSVERCFLGGTRPARWDPASVKRFSADLFHACFVLSGAFLRVEADSDDRKRLDTKERVGGWGVRGEASRPPRPRCIAGLAEKVSALSGPRQVGWTKAGHAVHRNEKRLAVTTRLCLSALTDDANARKSRKDSASMTMRGESLDYTTPTRQNPNLMRPSLPQLPPHR